MRQEVARAARLPFFDKMLERVLSVEPLWVVNALVPYFVEGVVVPERNKRKLFGDVSVQVCFVDYKTHSSKITQAWFPPEPSAPPDSLGGVPTCLEP